MSAPFAAANRRDAAHLLCAVLIWPALALAATGELSDEKPLYQLPEPGSYELPVIDRVGRYELLNASGERVPLLDIEPGGCAVVSFVHGGLRTISDEQLDRARAAMRAIVAEHLPHTDAEIFFVDRYPAMPPTDGNMQLHTMLSSINEELGGEALPALDPSRRGAADISFIAPYTDALGGLGGQGENMHSPNERLDLDSLPAAVKRAAILIYRLTREGA